MSTQSKRQRRFVDDGQGSPIDFDRAAGQQIFEAVKSSILCMEFEPGTLISEKEIARRYSASRTPVREAFMRLREAGLVNTWPSRGNFVTKLSEARIREARYIREAIELANVEHLANNGMSDDLEKLLRVNLEQQRACIADITHDSFQDLDDQFHFLLAKATGFERAASLLENEKMALDRLRVLSLADNTHKQMLFSEHQAILDAVVSRDIEKAKSQMRSHLNSILKTLSSLAEKHESYFE